MFNFLIGVVIGGWIVYFFIRARYRLEPPLPFSWKCDFPGCVFEISTNNEDPSMLMRVVEHHRELHDKRGI